MDKEELHEFGDFEINNTALETIIGQAAIQVEGVYDLSGGYIESFIDKLNRKVKTKGIKTEVVDSTINIKLSLVVKSGYVLEEVSRNVRDKVMATISKMLGLKTGTISIDVKDVFYSKKE